ncbi:MAG: 23S rRNA (guanosine(2251)-2'-O)-methyltransferase RlmB [Bacilli bacterium]|nr:23S rRNA (guanosine(2251)-2'-O)-methyltransferase RlmB [Bacilli bacterium]
MYICGRNVAKEYLINNEIINNIYLQENFSDQEVLRLIEKKKYNVKIVKKYELDKMTKENHQGIILKVNDFKYSDLDSFTKKDDSLVVLLDHIEDPHNFGAIIRTCEAANVDGIIIPKNRSVDVNSTVIRTSVGATKYVPVAQVTNIKSTIDKLKKDGYWIVGTDMNGTNYSQIDYKGKTCIIIGNEGSGMARIVRENCDFIAEIPMKGKINSLNASVAAGIIIYEAVKQRG